VRAFIDFCVEVIQQLQYISLSQDGGSFPEDLMLVCAGPAERD
jgi:hypothetical protein